MTRFSTSERLSPASVCSLKNTNENCSSRCGHSLKCPHHAVHTHFRLCALSLAFYLKGKKKKAVIERESRPQYQRAALRLKPPELMVDPGAHIRCGRSILASLFSRMQNESVVTLHNVYCLPPIFPEMWRRLEAFEA